VENSVNLQKDVLTIGITGPFERKHVPFIVKQFKENDAISIDIKAFNLFTCIEKLNNREIDIAFGLPLTTQHNKERAL